MLRSKPCDGPSGFPFLSPGAGAEVLVLIFSSEVSPSHPTSDNGKWPIIIVFWVHLRLPSDRGLSGEEN